MRNNPRDQIPALKNKYYFNYGGQGPLPKSSLEAIVKTWEIIQDLGPFTNDMWPFIYKEILTTKRIIAQKIRCQFKECSFYRKYLFRYDFALLGNKSRRGRRVVNK